MNNTDFTEQWTAVQKMFLPTSTISAPLRENAHRFWESQEKVLDSMQALANAWFERRHAGAHKAREAAERICGTETFVDLIQAYQDSAGGRSSGLWPMGFRASNNHGGNRSARVTAISAFDNRKGDRAPAIQNRGRRPARRLRDCGLEESHPNGRYGSKADFCGFADTDDTDFIDASREWERWHITVPLVVAVSCGV